MEHERGITVLELVLAIVVLSILAAFVVPKFVSFSTEAKTELVNTMSGSIHSLSSIAHAFWVASKERADSLTVNGQEIRLVNGYPSAATLLNGIQETDGFRVITRSNRVILRLNNAERPNTCDIRYRQATANRPPILRVRTSGC